MYIYIIFKFETNFIKKKYNYKAYRVKFSTKSNKTERSRAQQSDSNALNS